MLYLGKLNTISVAIKPTVVFIRALTKRGAYRLLRRHRDKYYKGYLILSVDKLNTKHAKEVRLWLKEKKKDIL